jgi:hypothetical protein
MLGLGAYTLLFVSVQATAIILLVFGGVCLAMSLADIRRFTTKKTPKPMAWFFGHLGRMMGSYIATFTAFSATNLSFLPTLVTWLLPSLIGTIGIILFSRHYRKKFKLK